MLRIFARNNSAELVAYHQDDITDAASEQASVHRAAWFGKSAPQLGLTGKAERTSFRRLCRNQDPRTGRRLTQRNSSRRHAAYDCVFSAPKSLSILALVMDDPRLINAHADAVVEVTAEMEKVAMARVRRQKVNTDRITDNVVGASFEHYLSREDDPQLHTHNVVLNATWDAEEKQWKALQASEFYNRSGFFTALYRHYLTARLNRLGYETRRTARSFEIKGVCQEVIDLFSKRHAEINRREADFGSAGNPRLRAGIARRCRRPKSEEGRSLDDLRASWLAELTTVQIAQLRGVQDAATKRVQPRRISAARAIRLAAEHLFERHSSALTHELLAEALIVAAGQHDLAKLEKALASDQRLHRHNEHVFSAQETMTLFRLFWFVQDGIGKAPPLSSAPTFALNLDAEQQLALHSLLGCCDQIMHLRGAAGTGKTRLLQELNHQLCSVGRLVVALAPTTAAVQVLRENGFEGAMTLQRFFRMDREGGFGRKSVIILDESSQVSVAQMHRLFEAAQVLSARVLLVGDTRQHGSVEAGDALRFLERGTRLHRAELTTVRRQTFALYRQAVERLRDGEVAAGFRALERLGWVHEIVEEEPRCSRLAKAYVDCRRAKRSALVICATWREVHAVSHQIRRELGAAGLIACEEHSVSSLVPLNLTLAKRRQTDSYEPGQTIVFREERRGFKPGHNFLVVEVAAQHLIVRHPCGRDFVLRPRSCAVDYSVFTTRQIHLAAGDEVLIMENYRLDSSDTDLLRNGDLATVARITHSGDVVLADGRTIPARFRHFTHGYAITSQRAQSQTVDEVFLSIDAQSAFCAATTETLYIGASRGRERCTIFTDDKELLKQAFLRSGRRLSAFDLMTIPKL